MTLAVDFVKINLYIVMVRQNTPDPQVAARTRKLLIDLLKREGPIDATSIARTLGLTTMAVRLHLKNLEGEGLIGFVTEHRAMGRPAQLWQLTTAADHLFPAGYAELALSLVESMKETFGSEGLERLLDSRYQHQLAGYQNELSKVKGTGDRVVKLAELRTLEGYMAEAVRLPDGEFRLIERHCPICSVAQRCQGLCARELEMFRELLGGEIEVVRTEHMIRGGPRCSYSIKPFVGTSTSADANLHAIKDFSSTAGNEQASRTRKKSDQMRQRPVNET